MITLSRRVPVFLGLILLIPGLLGAQGAPTRPETTPPFPAYTPASVSWWKDRVFYEVFVHSFQDSDGDGKGDLKGLISRLDYIQSLGFKGLWLMPVNKTAENQEHGYHPTDFKDINPSYGTMADFKQLLAECKKRDIKVLFDLVINHTSKDHPWFIASTDPASPYRSWFRWDETGAKRNNWHTLPEAPTGPTYFGRFNFLIPDLNLLNPDVDAAVKDIAKFWLKDVGVDGFRMDAIKHLVEEGSRIDSTPGSMKWLADFNTYVKTIAPEAYTLGEVFGAGFEELRMYKKAQVDATFNFPFAGAAMATANFGAAGGMSTTLRRLLREYPEGDYATFLTNHDMDRVMTALNGNMESGKVAATLLLTTPGTPFVYYGEEIGQFGDKKKGGDPAWRRPMQWDSTPKTFGFTTGRPYGRGFDQGGDERNVADQLKDPNSLLNHYKALIALRNARPELRTGGTVLLDTGNSGVFAMLRYTDTSRTLVLINAKAEALTDYGLTLWNGPFTPTTKATVLFAPAGTSVTPPVINGTGGVDYWKPVGTLPAKTTVILGL